MWHFPGGTFLFGEKVKDAIKRISEEETGLKLKVIKILGIIEYAAPSVYGYTVSVAFLVKPISGKLRGSSQAKEIKYFNKIPKETVKEQVIFLKENSLLN